MWNQRSVDTPLGLPFNIASYGLLLSLLAKHVNMIPNELIGNLGDTHIYLNQMDGVKEQLTRTGFDLPQIIIEKVEINDISEYKIDHIQLFNYQSQPKINFPLSN
jgi:thymidylate synthase